MSIKKHVGIVIVVMILLISSGTAFGAENLKTVSVNYLNSIKSTESLAINRLTMQKIDNNFVFTLHYTARTNKIFSFFDPPNGSYLMYFGELSADNTKVSFSIPVSRINGLDTITMKFWEPNADKDDFIHFRTTELYKKESVDQTRPPADTDFLDSEIGIIIGSKVLGFTHNTGAPFIDKNSRTQVPLRITMESYGCSVLWDAANKIAIVSKSDVVVKVPIGTTYIIVNEKVVTTDTAASIKNNRVYLPIRAVLEAFNATVSWDGSAKMVVVSRPPLKENFFVDKNLEFAVRRQIGKLLGDLKEDDLLEITELVARQDGITNLAGIENLVNLKKLSLSGENISDIRPLSSLYKLETLNLFANNITDLTPIRNLTDLEYLEIGYNPGLNDISVIKNLEYMWYLSIRGTGVDDLTPAIELKRDSKNLRCVYFSDSKVNLKNQKTLEYVQYLIDNKVTVDY